MESSITKSGLLTSTLRRAHVYWKAAIISLFGDLKIWLAKTGQDEFIRPEDIHHDCNQVQVDPMRKVCLADGRTEGKTTSVAYIWYVAMRQTGLLQVMQMCILQALYAKDFV